MHAVDRYLLGPDFRQTLCQMLGHDTEEDTVPFLPSWDFLQI